MNLNSIIELKTINHLLFCYENWRNTKKKIFFIIFYDEEGVFLCHLIIWANKVLYYIYNFEDFC